MKTFKMCLVLILVVSIMVIGLNDFWSMEVQGAVQVPSTIRVGIRYGSDSPKSVEVKAPKGFTLGWSDKKVFNSVINMPQGSSVFVRKDTFYSKGLYVPQEGTASNSEFGPYRVQLGGNLSSGSAAVSKAAEYAASFGINCYPAYRSGWKVLTGDFKTANEATSYTNTVLKSKNSSVSYTTFSPTDTTIVISDNSYKTVFVFDGGTTLTFQVKATTANTPQVIQSGTNNFRGTMEFRRFSGTHITVVNVLSFEEYLYSVVSRELGYASTPIEAWKAQAVACRTYAYNSIIGSKHTSYDFDICNTSHCQNYAGYSNDSGYVYELSGINQSVDATKGLIATYNGAPAQIYYASSNGGYTEAAQNVWSATIPYLRTEMDPYDPVRVQNVTMTAREASTTLTAKGYDVGQLKKIEIRGRSASGRVLELYVEGTKGSKTISKSSTRGAFGLGTQMFSIKSKTVLQMVEGNLPSQLIDKISGKVYNKNFLNENTYTIQKIPNGGIKGHNNYYLESIIINNQDEILEFEAKGYGHGVGMSQLGAMEMGRQGKTFREIIEFYFKGTKVE